MKDGFICVAAGTPKIRVADCRYNAEQIFTMIREADKQGVKILALPELCLTGYTLSLIHIYFSTCLYGEPLFTLKLPSEVPFHCAKMPKS